MRHYRLFYWKNIKGSFGSMSVSVPVDTFLNGVLFGGILGLGSPALYSSRVFFLPSFPSFSLFLLLSLCCSLRRDFLGLKKKFEKALGLEIKGLHYYCLHVVIFKTHENWYMPVTKTFLPGH